MAEELPRERSSTTAIFDRITSLERGHSESQSQLTGITVTLTGLQASVGRIQQMVEARSATDWKTLAAWATVLLAVVGAFVQLVLGPLRGSIDSQAEAIRRLDDIRQLDVRQEAADHQRQIELAERRGRDAQRLDDLIRRSEEMRPP